MDYVFLASDVWINGDIGDCIPVDFTMENIGSCTISSIMERWDEFRTKILLRNATRDGSLNFKNESNLD